MYLQKKKEEEQMSLDEYMKQRKEAQESVERLSIREVERIDMKGLKPVEKDEVKYLISLPSWRAALHACTKARDPSVDGSFLNHPWSTHQCGPVGCGRLMPAAQSC